MIEELAKDYAAYADVSLPKEVKLVQETIEEMQTRLEEFGSLIGMLQIEGAKCTSENVPLFRSLRPQLANLCNRIDALEKFVDRVGVDLATLEADVENAEADLSVPEKRFGILNFFKKSAEAPSTTRNVGVYRPPVLFQTSNYFENTE